MFVAMEVEVEVEMRAVSGECRGTSGSSAETQVKKRRRVFRVQKIKTPAGAAQTPTITLGRAVGDRVVDL